MSLDCNTSHSKFNARWSVVFLALGLSACSFAPKNITTAERQARIQQDWQAIFTNTEPYFGKLTLYQSMARAIKYNLDLKLKQAEQAYAQADTNLASATMLPQLIAEGGYTARNNSYSVRSPNNPGTLTSTEDRDQHDGKLQFSWNVLDFGISYLDAKQKADLFLITQERKRHLLQQITKDIRFTYWQAWAAQNLSSKISPFIHEINDAVTMSHRAEREQLIPPAKAAYFRAELWQTYDEMYQIYSNLMQAKPELLAMLRIHPNAKVWLSQPTLILRQLPKNFPLDKPEQLQQLALHHRPELREEDYQKRTRLTEITKSKLKFLPQLNITAGKNYDSNSFLINKQWADFAIRTTLDLLQVFSKYYALKSAKIDAMIADLRRQALSIAVLTQVEVSRLAYLEAEKRLKIARHIRDNRYQHYLHLANEQKVELNDKLSIVNAKAKWLLAKLKFNLAYAQWANASSQLLNTVGYDPLHNVQTLDLPVNQLAKQIQQSLDSAPSTNA